MDEQERDRAVEWLHSQAGYPSCPACHQDVEWGMGSDLLKMANAVPREHPAYVTMAVLPFICPQCGYVMFLEAKTIGIIDTLEHPYDR